METYILLVTLISIGFFTTSVAEPSVVVTDLGRIIGKVKTVEINGNDVSGTDVKVKTFLGIPYAKPPTGERRFRKPEKVEKFDGDYHADQFGSVCVQPATETFIAFPKMSEDCLFLNIYIPDQAADEETGHAVMVFIHGGGFQHGAGDIYPGDSLASTGNVIVVTLNYRLGLMGFLSSGDSTMPGNYGLWDQHMALQWINEHIGRFGGDPSRVTLFGESAGASSVIYQGFLPQNKGLLNRIIAQSGAPGLKLTLNSRPREQFNFIAQVTGCLQEEPLKAIACVRKSDAKSMLMAMRQVAMSKPDLKAIIAMIFFPTVDGDFFKTSPCDWYATSKTGKLDSVEFFRSLDVMIGHNNQEGALMLHSSLFYPIPDMDTFMPTRDDLTTVMIDAVMIHVFAFEPAHEAVKSMFISEFTDWSADPLSPENIRQQYVDMMGQVAFEKSTIEFIRIHANATSLGASYAYVFDAAPSVRLLKTPSWVSGANHADELVFVFGFMDDLVEGFMQKPVPPMVWEWELSKYIQTRWSNFAKTGNPNELTTDSSTWPQYDIRSQQCINFRRDMNDGEPVTIPFCNARRAQFLLDTVPEVTSALDSRHGESSPFTHDRSCTAESHDLDGKCDAP